MTMQLNQTDRIDERNCAQYAAVFSALPDAIVIVDGSGEVREANRASLALIGESPVGRIWREVVLELFQGSEQGYLRTRQDRVIKLDTFPLGEMPGQVVVVRDITDIRQLERQLHRHHRLSEMGRMAASLAHQVRTPLSTALLYLSQLANGALPPPRQQKYVQKTLERLRHLESLIQGMLRFSRGETLNREEVALADLMRTTEQTSRALIPAGVQLQVISPDAEAHVYASRTLLQSAIQNLVNNAIEAVSPSGAVRVQCHAEAGQWLICVSNDGRPLEPAILAHLFEPQESDKAEGNGLGLSVVRAIARAHHGDCYLHRNDGGDVTFTLRLPAANAFGGDEKTEKLSRMGGRS